MDGHDCHLSLNCLANICYYPTLEIVNCISGSFLPMEIFVKLKIIGDFGLPDFFSTSLMSVRHTGCSCIVPI